MQSLGEMEIEEFLWLHRKVNKLQAELDKVKKGG